jgi:hypothetical protein
LRLSAESGFVLAENFGIAQSARLVEDIVRLANGTFTGLSVFRRPPGSDFGRHRAA